jgi:iron-sulfur cluster assembly protein
MNAFNSISMTPAAIMQLQRKITEKGSGKGLRVGLKKRGCSGLAYDLSIVDTAMVDETVFLQSDELFVCIPHKDLPFVSGMTIDYVKEGLGAHFKFINPHEVAACGCGESFTVKE